MEGGGWGRVGTKVRCLDVEYSGSSGCKIGDRYGIRRCSWNHGFVVPPDPDIVDVVCVCMCHVRAAFKTSGQGSKRSTAASGSLFGWQHANVPRWTTVSIFYCFTLLAVKS